MVAWLLILPTLSFAQQNNDVELGRSAGEADALSQSTATWFLLGCLLGVVGWLIAYVVEPSPNSINLLGKTPEFVAGYTAGYKEKLKSRNTSSAMTGCLVGTVASVLFYALTYSESSTTN